MFGLEFLLAGQLEMAVTKVQDRTFQGNAYISGGKIERTPCTLRKSPTISVLPTKSNIRYDFTKSKAELNNFDIDTISPYGPGAHTDVGGLMEGEIQVSQKISFMFEEYRNSGQACVHYDKIDVKIHIDPTIYVASDFPPGSCEHNAVLGHERKHIKMDRLIVNKYAKRIGREIYRQISRAGFSYGPVNSSSVKSLQKQMQDNVSNIVKAETDRMNEERRRRQQGIDNLAEYERVRNACR